MAGGQNSNITEMVPFLIEPRFVPRVWGYSDLRPWYDFEVDGSSDSPASSGGEPIGEVWLTGDDCRAATGPHSGASLSALFQNSAAAMLGSAAPSAQSPLLIKMIFAREKLSVQVHPDDRLAQKYGQPRGKTECWYSLASDPDAMVAAGLKSGVTMDQVRAAITDGTLERSLNVLSVSTGDMIFVDAGTVHAIWPGSILLETQQNCDITYRMYDYGRPRELHIERSLEATRLETRAGKVPPRPLPDRTILIDVEYFRVERIHVDKQRASETLPASDEEPGGLSFLFAAAGSARIQGHDFEPLVLPARGISAIPAASPAFAVENLGGLDLIRISPRWPAEKQ
jgi:mannose-6-phosphate isomerase